MSNVSFYVHANNGLSVKIAMKCSTRKEERSLKHDSRQTAKGQHSNNKQRAPQEPNQDISNGLL